jgi:adenosine deaminase
VLQTEAELAEGTLDVLRQLHAENVRLCELRFCPSLHTLEGLSPAEAVWAVVRGFQQGSLEFDMQGGIILCGLRSCSPAITMEIAELCGQLKEETGGVVLGYDIAGDEGFFPINEHLPSLQRAGQLGVGVTCHAGEWPVNEAFGTKSLDNLHLVLQNRVVSRVGHGIQLVHDEDLLRQAAASTNTVACRGQQQQVCFECCLSANVGWKVPSYAEHPVKRMIRAGVKVALCCDNLLLSGAADRVPSPSNEIVHFIRDVGMSYDDLAAVLLNSAQASFVFRVQQWDEQRTTAWLRDFEYGVRQSLVNHNQLISS